MNKTILDNKTVKKIKEEEGTVFNEIVYLTARAFIAAERREEDRRGEKKQQTMN